MITVRQVLNCIQLIYQRITRIKSQRYDRLASISKLGVRKPKRNKRKHIPLLAIANEDQQTVQGEVIT